MTKLKTAASGRNDQAGTPAAHAVLEETTPPVAHPTDDRGSPLDRAGESAVRATDFPAIHQFDPTPDDDIDRLLGTMGLARRDTPVADPRAEVLEATSMTNIELGDLFLRVSAESERVARLRAKQKYVVGKIRNEVRDRETVVRRSATSGGAKLDDLVWSDAIYRALRGALLLHERVLDELEADLAALERHHASISRLVEIRRQEQQRDLIDVNIPNRKPGWGRR